MALLPVVALAQDEETNIPDSITELLDLFSRIGSWMLQFFWVAAVISGVYTAYLYLTGGSKPDNISKAHRQLIYTVVAIFVVIIAFTLPSILNSIIANTS